MRKTLLAALAALVLASAAAAQDRDTTATEDARGEGHEIFGLETHPYVGLTALRPSSSDDDATGGEIVSESWTVGLVAGVDVDVEPFWVGASYDLFDVLDEENSYPFDGAFTVHLGLYRGDSTGSLYDLKAEPYVAITLTRPSGPDEWSTGFEGGVEFLLEPLYIGAEYELHDILTDDEDEVYPFDGTFTLSVGAYW